MRCWKYPNSTILCAGERTARAARITARLTSRGLCAVLLCLSLLAANANADPFEAVNFDGAGAVNDGPFGGYVLGWEFTVNSPITITNVGWFDDGSGLSMDHPVGIFDTTGHLLGKATVSPTDTLVPSVDPQPGAGFRYHALDSPFGLDVGTYRIGGHNPVGSIDKNYDFVQNLTTSLGVSYVHSYYQPAGSLTYPATFGDREKGYFGPNFLFNDGPGPPPPPPPPPPPVDKVPAISVNFASDVVAGVNVEPADAAGKIRSTNWNNVPMAQQTAMPLVNNVAATVDGLTLTTNETFTFPASAYDSGASFAFPGDRAMMRGHIYHASPTTADVHIDGTIPYANYDVYVYYNSGAVFNTQKLSILGSDLSDLGLTKTVYDVPGGDVEYVLAVDATTNANYIKFTNLNNLDLPSFVLRAQADAGYGYVNGLQIVQILLGDANGDGTADFSDLGILLNHYNQTGEFADGDFDNTATVEFADLGILLNNYNQTIALPAPLSAASSAQVPEPGTLGLAAMTCLGLALLRRRFHRKSIV